MPARKPKTLEQILNAPIVGNFHSDHGLFMDIDNFVQDESNSYADRARVLRFMSEEVMGIACDQDAGETDKQIVNRYIRECSM